MRRNIRKSINRPQRRSHGPSVRELREMYAAQQEEVRKAVAELEQLAERMPAPVPRRGELPPMSPLLRGNRSAWKAFKERAWRDSGLGTEKRRAIQAAAEKHIVSLLDEVAAVSEAMPPRWGSPIRIVVAYLLSVLLEPPKGATVYYDDEAPVRAMVPILERLVREAKAKRVAARRSAKVGAR